jgi:hypothetical protein
VLYTTRKFLHHYASATLIDVLHSPFVFGLYNNCFKTKSNIKLTGFTPASKGYFNLRCETVVAKLKLYFPGHYFTTDINSLPTDKPFIFLIEDETSLETIQQKLTVAHNDSIVIVKNMYTNLKHTENWQQLKATQNVTASINLFFIGMLFVRKEQLKQEFRLRLF